jgi:hypothetical protein
MIVHFGDLYYVPRFASIDTASFNMAADGHLVQHSLDNLIGVVFTRLLLDSNALTRERGR